MRVGFRHGAGGNRYELVAVVVDRVIIHRAAGYLLRPVAVGIQAIGIGYRAILIADETIKIIVTVGPTIGGNDAAGWVVANRADAVSSHASIEVEGSSNRFAVLESP